MYNGVRTDCCFPLKSLLAKVVTMLVLVFRYIHMPVVVRIREMGCGHTANPRGSFRNTIHKKNGRKFPDQMSVKDFQAQLFPRHFLFRQQTKDLHVGPSNLTCSLWKRRIHLFFNFWLRFHLYYLAKSGHRGPQIPSTGSLWEKKSISCICPKIP